MASQSVTASGETVEQAIQAGLTEINAAKEDVKIEIVDAGKGGVLGIGKKPAIVKLTLLSGVKPSTPPADTKPAPKKAKPADSKPAPKAKTSTQANRPGKLPPIGSGSDEKAEPKAPPKPKAKPASKPKPKSKQKSERPEKKSAKPKSRDNRRPDDYELPNAEELAEESAVASEMMAELFDIMEIEVDVQAELTDKDDLGIQIPIVKIIGEGLDPLVGNRGSVLNDLQFVARSMVSQRLQRRTSFVIDIDGYRHKRMQELVDLARHTAKQVVESRRPIALNPMPPHERRVIHMTLRDDNKVETQSKGDGNRRRVRVIPKRNSGRSKSRR